MMRGIVEIKVLEAIILNDWVASEICFCNGSARVIACSLLGLSLVLDELASDSVHVSLAFFGEGLASGLGSAVLWFVLDLTDESLLLELLQAVSDDLSTGLSLMGWADSPSLLATVVSSQGWDSDLSSYVQLVCNWGSSHVEPVSIIGGELLEACGLNIGGPLFNII